jgi:hypothetical protein
MLLGVVAGVLIIVFGLRSDGADRVISIACGSLMLLGSAAIAVGVVQYSRGR